MPQLWAKVRVPKKPMSFFTKAILGLLGLTFLGVFVMQSIEKDKAKQSEAQRVASMTSEQRAKENTARAKRDTELQMGHGRSDAREIDERPGERSPHAQRLGEVVLADICRI